MIRSPEHLAKIRNCPCLYRGNNCGGDVQACHIRKGTDGGMGIKPSDIYVIPMCNNCHAKQHNEGEESFHARKAGVSIERLKSFAQNLWGMKPDAMKLKVRNFRNDL